MRPLASIKLKNFILCLLSALYLAGCVPFNALTDTTERHLKAEKYCLVYLSMDIKLDKDTYASLESNWENIDTGEIVYFPPNLMFHLITPGTYVLRDFNTPNIKRRDYHYRMLGLGDNGIKFEASKSKVVYTGDVYFDMSQGGDIVKNIAYVKDYYNRFNRILNKENPSLINYSQKSLMQIIDFGNNKTKNNIDL